VSEVLISISSPSLSDSRDDGHVTLHIEDGVSGTVLVDVDIPAGRWWRLCQGTVQRHDAFISSHLDRVGKAMENTSANLGPAWGMTKERAQEAADAHPLRAEYDTAEVRRTNAGWVAVFRRWVSKDGA
jgi:hypothetical protein